MNELSLFDDLPDTSVPFVPDGRIMKPVPLRPYQAQSIEAIKSSFKTFKHPLLIMPTGCGKTVVFAELVKSFAEAGKRSLVLAHRDELIAQAFDKIATQSGLRGGIEKAESKAFLDDRLVIGSVQTLSGSRLSRFPSGHFDLIVVDEAHHAVSPTYGKLLNHFPDSKVLGVTATPDRVDKKELGGYFDTIAYQYQLRDAIKEGYLANILGRRVRDFEIDLSNLRTRMGDFVEEELETIIEKYIKPIAAAVYNETKDLKTLIFLPSVESAKLLSEELNRQGLVSAHLSGNSSPEMRQYQLAKFHRGETTHLCNCNLFLEGFDEPTIEAVVMARPTMSRTIYAQAIGRGTRLAPGKKEMKLVEFTYDSSNFNLVTAYELFSGEGYEEKVRKLAMKRGNKKAEVNFFEDLEEAHKDFYEPERIMKNIRVKENGFEYFDVFKVAALSNLDLEGEFTLTWQGREVKGAITEKQKALLKKYRLSTRGLDRAKASRVISELFAKRLVIPR